VYRLRQFKYPAS